MIKINFYTRYPSKRLQGILGQFFQVRLNSSKSQDEDVSPQDTSDKKVKNKEASDKLNLLLKQIIRDDVVRSESKIQLAKPKPKKGVKTEIVKTETVEKVIISSVKNVAESLGGNVKQTESELLSKLLNSVDENIQKTEAEPTSLSLSDIIKDMKIDRTTKSAESVSRAQQVRNILQATRGSTPAEGTQMKYVKTPIDMQHFTSREKERVVLFGKDKLGIFSDVSQHTENEINETWKKLYERDLRLMVTHPPSNYFQQLILWTEQGKLWKFPIDNEQGMDEEKKVYFADHVFLEKHLEPWCPPKGPIRHFMELVCVGLSKNPYMTVKRKQEHISWYRDYFKDKQQLLQEVGAIPADFKEIEGGEDLQK